MSQKYCFTPEGMCPQGPPFVPIGSIEEALPKTEIVYSYYTPKEIEAVKSTFVNDSSLALKGLTTAVELLRTTDGGRLYRAHVALGNVPAHDNLRVVAGGKRQYGFTPPETFAHDFGNIFSKYYPLPDLTEVKDSFEFLRPGRELHNLQEENAVGAALSLRLEYITGVLGRSIKVGSMNPEVRQKNRLFAGSFKLTMPHNRKTKSEFRPV